MKKGKRNVFSGSILEIEGLPDLKVDQAFELSDATAERSAAACVIALNKAPLVEYMRSNITLMKWMIAEGRFGRDSASSLPADRQLPAIHLLRQPPGPAGAGAAIHRPGGRAAGQ